MSRTVLLRVSSTPAYPPYAANMAVVGAGAAPALQLRFGANDVPNTLTWRQSGGLPQGSYQLAGFREAAEQQSMARIHGGVHYRFDQEAGQRIGIAVAEFVFTNGMTPRRRGKQ
jgi:hypothetical protein